jgi:hypothetical protein
LFLTKDIIKINPFDSTIKYWGASHMKRYGFSFNVFVLVFCLLTAGCAIYKAGTGRIITGPAAKDLAEYINQGILRIAELERRSLESYASVIGENYTTDKRVYEELKDFVIPTYKRFVDELKNIRPENEEVMSLHGIYIRGAELIYEGFKAKMMGIENNDEGIIIMANEKIEMGRDEIERWNLERIELYKKHGVAQIEDE